MLLCPTFDVQRQDPLARVAELLRPVVQIADLSIVALNQLLLYGNQNLSNDLNRNILDLFDCDLLQHLQPPRLRPIPLR